MGYLKCCLPSLGCRAYGRAGRGGPTSTRFIFSSLAQPSSVLSLVVPPSLMIG